MSWLLWIMQISLRVPTFYFFGYIPRSGIAGSYGNFIVISFLRNCHMLSIMTAPITIPTHWHKGSVFFTSFPMLIIFFSFISAVLADMRWYPMEVLMIIRNIDHLFTYLCHLSVFKEVHLGPLPVLKSGCLYS